MTARLPNYPRFKSASALDGWILGREELVDLFESTPGAVAKWFQRETLPPADGPMVNGLPTWRRDTIMWWAWLENRLQTPSGRKVTVFDEAGVWAQRAKDEGRDKREATPVRVLRVTESWDLLVDDNTCE